MKLVSALWDAISFLLDDIDANMDEDDSDDDQTQNIIARNDDVDVISFEESSNNDDDNKNKNNWLVLRSTIIWLHYLFQNNT